MSNESFWDGNPKAMFIFGFVLGIAVSAVLALVVLLSSFTSGRSLVGLGTGGTIGAAAPTQGAGQPTPSAQVAPPVQPVKAVSASDHIRGPKNAKVTLIEYSDFQCPYCKRFEPTLQQAVKAFPNDIRIVYRHFPLTQIHPQAQKAAEASECAAKLGGESAFWKLHDLMLAETADLSVTSLATMAKGLGLNETKFKSCVDSGEMKAIVDAQAASGEDAGVQGTPATFVNGQLVTGAQPYSAIEAAIQAAGGKG